MTGQYHYELPFVHIEATPEAYTRNINGDDDTIDSESEDIRHDLKGTPTNSRRPSYSTGSEYATTSFYPQRDPNWSDCDSNKDETSSDTVYPNKSLLNELCDGHLPPILSLGDYEDEGDDVVITNPYLYSDHIPVNASPKRSAKGTINLEALTTLESSGEYGAPPQQYIPNYRRKHSKSHKALRKTKSELNLEDATKITGAARYYHTYQSKSRIDLREATRLGHSDTARVNHQHRKAFHTSTPKILDSSSKLERLTALDT